MNRGAWIFAAGICCVGTSVWVLSGAVGSPDRGDESKEKAEVGDLSERLTLLERENEKVRHELALSTRVHASIARRIDGAEPSNTSDVPATPQREEDENEGNEQEDESSLESQQNASMERFEANLQALAETEGSDRAWTASVEEAFLEKLAMLENGPDFESAQCGSSLCTVVVTHQEDGAHSELVMAMQGNTADWGGQFLVRRHEDQDGGYRTTFYFSKPGERIPELNSALAGEYN